MRTGRREGYVRAVDVSVITVGLVNPSEDAVMTDETGHYRIGVCDRRLVLIAGPLGDLPTERIVDV